MNECKDPLISSTVQTIIERPNFIPDFVLWEGCPMSLENTIKKELQDHNMPDIEPKVSLYSLKDVLLMTNDENEFRKETNEVYPDSNGVVFFGRHFKADCHTKSSSSSVVSLFPVKISIAFFIPLSFGLSNASALSMELTSKE